MLYNLFRRKYKAESKVGLLFLSFVGYGLIYFFFCYDTEFRGINIVQDKLRDDVVQTYVEKVKKNELTMKAEKDIGEKLQSGDVHTDSGKQISEQVEPEVKQISKSVTQKSSLQEFYDRFYFAVVTGTTLGYGDIQPASNKVKFLTLCQLMTTIYILIS